MAGAQSGRGSSVGFVIESAFRSAPVTNISGNNYYPGIPATNPNRFFIAEPGGGYSPKPTKDVGESEIDGNFSIKRVTMTGKTYEGKDSFKVDPENLYYPLLGILGKDVESTLTSGALHHVMTPYKHLPSFTQEEQFGDATYGRLSTGVVFSGLNLTFGAILMAELTYHAHRQIPNRYPAGTNDVDYDYTSTPALLPSQLGGDGTKLVKLTVAPTYVDVAEGNCGNGPLVFANMQFGSESGFSNSFLTINDVAYAGKILPGYNVQLTRNIESWMTGGSGYDPGQPVGNVFSASGKLTFLFEDNTIPANVNANCKFGINMKFIGAQIASTGFYYTLEIFLPRVKFLESDGPIRNDKTMTVGGSFQAEYDAAAQTECKITLRNSFTHAALAGTESGTVGGLGGWTATP